MTMSHTPAAAAATTAQPWARRAPSWCDASGDPRRTSHCDKSQQSNDGHGAPLQTEI
jgi:hypothetical protein